MEAAPSPPDRAPASLGKPVLVALFLLPLFVHGVLAGAEPAWKSDSVVVALANPDSRVGPLGDWIGAWEATWSHGAAVVVRLLLHALAGIFVALFLASLVGPAPALLAAAVYALHPLHAAGLVQSMVPAWHWGLPCAWAALVWAARWTRRGPTAARGATAGEAGWSAAFVAAAALLYAPLGMVGLVAAVLLARHRGARQGLRRLGWPAVGHVALAGLAVVLLVVLAPGHARVATMGDGAASWLAALVGPFGDPRPADAPPLSFATLLVALLLVALLVGAAIASARRARKVRGGGAAARPADNIGRMTVRRAGWTFAALFFVGAFVAAAWPVAGSPIYLAGRTALALVAWLGLGALACGAQPAKWGIAIGQKRAVDAPPFAGLPRLGPAAVVPVLVLLAALGVALVGALGANGTRRWRDTTRAWSHPSGTPARATADEFAFFQHAAAALAGTSETTVSHATLAALAADEGRALPRRIEAMLLRADPALGAPLGDRLSACADALASVPALSPDVRLPRGDARVFAAHAHRLRGMGFAEVPDRESAFDACRRALLLDDQAAENHEALGVLLASARREEDRARAAALFEGAIARAPRRLSAYLHLALLLGGEGEAGGATAAAQATAAEAVLARAEHHHRGHPDLLFARARLALSARRDVGLAQSLLKQIRESATGERDARAARLEAEIHVALARSNLDFARERPDQRQGLEEEALRRLDLALVADPTHWPAHVFAGDALDLRGRPAEARARYGAALAIAPDLLWLRDARSRSAMAEAGRSAARNEDPAQVAARVVEAVRDAARSIDLGFATLGLERELLAELATTWESGPAHAAEPARDVLVACALLMGGREPEALAAVQLVLQRLGDASETEVVRQGAVMMRAMVAERSALLVAARGDYDWLAARRPKDLLPRLRMVELDLRTAIAHSRSAALAGEGDVSLVESALALEEAAKRALALAEEEKSSLDATLVAVEADMHRRRWLDALARLNEASRRHPDAPAVHRGFATVYVEHYQAEPDASLIESSDRNLREALRLDPRDVRTLLAAAQLSALAKDFAKAARYGEEALRFELVPRGPARRQLVKLDLDLARHALESGRADAVRAAIERARKRDPSHPGPDRLEAELLLGAVGRARSTRLDEALKLAQRAKEIAPFDREIDPILARIHRERAVAQLVAMSAVRMPAAPANQGTDEATVREAHEAAVARASAEKARWRSEAIASLEESLRAEGTGPEADATRARLEALRAGDPESQRARMQEAQSLYLAARAAQRNGPPEEALRQYLAAVELHSGYGQAHFGVVQTAYEALQGLRTDADAPDERALADRRLEQAYRSLQALDALDPLGQFPLRWYYRGLLHRYRYRRDADEAMREAARRAFRQYLALLPEDGAGQDAQRETARIHLADLTRRGDD